jgi:formamidopyrimidine-DNA glycosylase
MPELPEVETVARGLAQRVAGDTIESVWIGRKPEPLKSPARQIAATLEGSRIASVRRVGKHIVVDLQQGKKQLSGQWVVHLGMTGSLIVARADQEVVKHTHLIAKLASGRELRFVDPRRFGRLSVHRAENVFRAAGSEPLDVEFEAFARLFQGRQTTMKSALLNQKLLSGVGNIYADEALFRAGIRPRRRATKVTRQELKKLYDALRQVLREAITAGGSSISDYVNADGDEGLFQFDHRVYGREGEACLTCDTPVKRIVIAGRSAHYCPRCQK